jgi:hypothetical protein
MNTCQHCQTELTNPRAKNCQTCTGILNDANRKGAYGFVMEAIATAKADGLTGSDMHQAMQAAVRFGTARRNEWAAQYRKEQKQKAAERSQAIQFYQKNGYWKDAPDHDEDARKDIEAGKNFNPHPTIEPEIDG